MTSKLSELLTERKEGKRSKKRKKERLHNLISINRACNTVLSVKGDTPVAPDVIEKATRLFSGLETSSRVWILCEVLIDISGMGESVEDYVRSVGFLINKGSKSTPVFRVDILAPAGVSLESIRSKIEDEVNGGLSMAGAVRVEFSTQAVRISTVISRD